MKKVLRLTRKGLDELIDLLEDEPSEELFAALHRKAVKYAIDPHVDDVRSFYLKMAFFDVKKLDEEWRLQFRVLKEAVSYARGSDVDTIRNKTIEEARKVRQDRPLFKLLLFLNQFGPLTIEEFQFKIVGMSGIDSTVRKAIDEDLVKVFEPSTVDPYICLTFRGRHLLKNIN